MTRPLEFELKRSQDNAMVHFGSSGTRGLDENTIQYGTPWRV